MTSSLQQKHCCVISQKKYQMRKWASSFFAFTFGIHKNHVHRCLIQITRLQFPDFTAYAEFTLHDISPEERTPVSRVASRLFPHRFLRVFCWLWRSLEPRQACRGFLLGKRLVVWPPVADHSCNVQIATTPRWPVIKRTVVWCDASSAVCRCHKGWSRFLVTIQICINTGGLPVPRPSRCYI